MAINTRFIKRLVLPSLILGGIITIFSGLLPNTTQGILGVGYWGYPIPWIKQIVYPGAPRVILWHFFVLDWIFWMVLFLSLYYVISFIHRFKYEK
jgi:hypothetical protein